MKQSSQHHFCNLGRLDRTFCDTAKPGRLYVSLTVRLLQVAKNGPDSQSKILIK